MFFVASKVFWWLIQPHTWLLLLQGLVLWFLLKARYRAARWTLGISLLATIIVTQLPLAGLLIRPLEQRFPQMVTVTGQVDGIITLAGAVNPVLSDLYGGVPQLNGEAERVTEFVELARKHPEARLVYSGGTGALSGGISETVAAEQFLRAQGLDTSKIMFEGQSRTTYESAIITKELLHPAPGERWILVTSASHMPRAYGTFRKAGWEVIPYPVSYLAQPTFSWADRGYGTLQAAIHEWVGLLAYRLSGRL